jgi:hypothetical protein
MMDNEFEGISKEAVLYQHLPGGLQETERKKKRETQ